MLTHSSLDDIEYSNYTHSTRKGTESNRRRRTYHGHHGNRRKVHKKFTHSISDACAVCLDDATPLDTKLFPCGHSFHGQCLIQWVTINEGNKFNCPLCRQDIAHFIEMSGNQQLTDELIQIWNDHYLCNNNNTIQNHSAAQKPIKRALKTKIQNIEVTPPPIAPPVCEEPCIEPIAPVIIPPKSEMSVPPRSASVASTNASNSNSNSIWKYIWTLALYPISTAITTQRNALLAPAAAQNIYNSSDNYAHHYQYPFVPVPNSDRTTVNHHPSQRNDKCHYMQTTAGNIDKKTSMPPTRSAGINSTTSISDALRFDLVNVKAGACAGVCAATTTYLIAEQLKSELLTGGAFRRSLYPILAESVPNVAIFFTSYEHLKRYLFVEDSVNNGWYQTAAQRFMSAGIASSAACLIGSGSIGGKGLLPLRYAAFFSTFELCKDIVNKDHEALNLVSVATGAAIGGIISHSLYYPLLHYKNLSLVKVASVNDLASSTKSVLCKNVYRGFVSSLNKFLPPCVVCSCAFEYSKRYFKS